ncbi:MAG: hypothetical protein AAFP26_05380 [Planctomycetota bacterium]
MLVRFTDHKGKDRYINPIYVKSLGVKNDTETEIEISGWSLKLRVKRPMDEVATMISAAMPDAAAAIAAMESEQQAAQNQAAATGAVIG